MRSHAKARRREERKGLIACSDSPNRSSKLVRKLVLSKPGGELNLESNIHTHNFSAGIHAHSFRIFSTSADQKARATPAEYSLYSGRRSAVGRAEHCRSPIHQNTEDRQHCAPGSVVPQCIHDYSALLTLAREFSHGSVRTHARNHGQR